uniref:Peroxisomal ATPase PEX6 n=1 Tax=Graphocephala atropunctata TaxID=36148 RepID=A0A1B6LY61_9HEMI
MMGEESNTQVKFSVISVPTEYFLTATGSALISNVPLQCNLGSNALILNENNYAQLGFRHRVDSIVTWAVVSFDFNVSEQACKNSTLVSKKLVQVVKDARVLEDTIVISEDLIFNLENDIRLRSPNGVFEIDKSCVNVSVEDENVRPIKATKVVLSALQSEVFQDNSCLDNLLTLYFSVPKYLCDGDVFSVHVDEHHKYDLASFVNIDTVYFKVCELTQENGCRPSDSCCRGCIVDRSSTLYQVANQQGFLPPRRIPLYSHLSINSLCLETPDFVRTRNQILVPPSFGNAFNTLCYWIEPFIDHSKRITDIELSPIFLLSGQNGVGKSLLLKALSQYYGMRYWRVDCVNVGGAALGQSEVKLKAIFSQLEGLAPCLLHLPNIENLCQDADSKEDVRVFGCFKQQIRLLKSKWPVIVIATTQNNKLVSSSINQLFLEATTLNVPNCEQREDIIAYLFFCNGERVDREVLQTIASQTSGFVFRDLQALVALAFKEKYKRVKEGNEENIFIVSDFSKTINLMHKSYSESIGAPKVPSVSWKDVGGLEHLKKEILRSLKSNMFNSGLKRSGLLLHGPPGTGKTLLAKAVASQCSHNFLSVKGPELLNMYVGQSEHNVRDLFALAKVASPCIVFFDELDSLAPNRGRSGDSGGVMDRVVSQLLAEMDDLGEAGDVFILGATNRPDLIDPALLRPGRLDKLLYVGPCEDRSSQLSVISALTRKLQLAVDVRLEEMVTLLPASVTGAQVSALCSAAWLSCARQVIQNGEHKENPKVTVNRSHFLAALSSVFGEK